MACGEISDLRAPCDPSEMDSHLGGGIDGTKGPREMASVSVSAAQNNVTPHIPNNANAIPGSISAAALASTQQPRHVTVAATQFAASPDLDTNLRKAEHLVRDAARRGANIILLQELFASPYFPIEQREWYNWAISLDEDKGYIQRFQSLARELNVVLPLSFYERSNNSHFNSVLVIDADGSSLGVYRKAHIPQGPGYHEKYFFSPGNTGFKVFDTRFAKIGVGICWDQWFPEAARCMAIDGAEIMMFPTAIGSEPHLPAMDTSGHWQRCMSGHAASNMIPVIASNRIGKECGKDSDVSITFYGSSFMTDHTGQIVADAGRYQETILVNTYNLNESKYCRMQWGLYRDRRPDLYQKLVTYDGQLNPDRRAPYSVPPTQGQSVHHQPVHHNSTNVFARNMSTPGAASAAAVAAAAAAAASMPGMGPLTGAGPVQVTKKIDPEALMIGMEGDSRRNSLVCTPVNGVSGVGGGGLGAGGSLDLHEASFIGDVKLSAQRRPRGRCWVCRNKTTYECKICAPGPVPLCNRTARECWLKYHAGEISEYVPNKRGRKRRKDIAGEQNTNNNNGGGAVVMNVNVNMSDVTGAPNAHEGNNNNNVGVGVDAAMNIAAGVPTTMAATTMAQSTLVHQQVVPTVQPHPVVPVSVGQVNSVNQMHGDTDNGNMTNVNVNSSNIVADPLAASEVEAEKVAVQAGDTSVELLQ